VTWKVEKDKHVVLPMLKLNSINKLIQLPTLTKSQTIFLFQIMLIFNLYAIFRLEFQIEALSD
jgi:hypothetical protein